MGIFEKLSRLVRSNINDLIARAENPEKMLIQIIEDMRRQLAQAKQEVAGRVSPFGRAVMTWQNRRSCEAGSTPSTRQTWKSSGGATGPRRSG
jgi:phage shock protein A